VRPATRRSWPNGAVTHDELLPLKTIAARLPCDFQNPGRFVPGRPLVQGMRVALSTEVSHTYEELMERILHAGLAYADTVDQQTSLVVCDEPGPEQGRGYQAGELGIPLVDDAEFMALLKRTVGGIEVEMFADATCSGDQLALF
jgi:DNA polymerase III subunit epsilon